ncbi:MAG: sodium:solute symporter [Balneolaceae bacterium]|nr:sodium:solute symporter [Balneolaceae bacterium]
MAEFNLTVLDISIVIAYIIGVLWLGFWFGKRHEGAEDYFLAGRNLTWPLIGFSLFASNISSNTLIGLTGSGYAEGSGFSVFSYEWMAIVVLIIFAIFFLPFYLKNRIFTIPEFLERRYDYRSRVYASGIAIILNVFVDIAATLYAGGIVIQMIFPSFPLWTVIVGLAVIAGVYTISGGLSSVVYTDAIQAVILIVGSIFITYFAWNQSGGMEAVMQITDPSHFEIIKPVTDEELPWPGLITGVFLLGFYFWGTNQYITQRALASRTTAHGQWGAMFAGFLKLTILFIMIMPGAFARVLYPDIEVVDRVYPTMMFDLLPVGILGLVLAGLIAAMMSSIDSGLNSVSTLVTMDFYQQRHPEKNQEELMGIGRWITFIVMLIAVVWAPQIQNFEKLWDYLQYVLSWFSPPVLALFAMGLFWKRATKTGAMWCIAVGAVITVFAIGFNAQEQIIDFLYMTGIHFALCCIAHAVGSLLSDPPAPDVVENTVWQPAAFRKETAELKSMAWYKNYRYQAAALVAIVVVIILIF